ncbi:MAG: methyltransferase domain-containing protein [Rhodocyclaceae bacterium]|nr:methyltransferase domain-containing protein [Rhodocyclaceae bacterium]
MREFLSKPLSFLRDSSHSLDELGDLYHDFSLFGFSNRQMPGFFETNQKAKAPIIGAYIQWAVAKCKDLIGDEVSFIELFCADGYYAMLARHFGATSAVGLDNDQNGYFQKSMLIAERLKISNIRFVKLDVNEMDAMGCFDIVANLGGLYHVANPVEILRKSYSLAKKYLIVQTVVSMANSEPDYFEIPAPGWTWGSRFSRASFDQLIVSLGYDVVDSHFNVLEGNDRPEDRGSVYYLIRVS